MKISLDNSVLAASDYIAKTFGDMDGDFMKGLAAAGAHYKLHTQGVRMLKTLAGDSDYIDLDVLEAAVKKYLGNMHHDTSFKTMVGEIKISAGTPLEIIEFLKRYGEN